MTTRPFNVVVCDDRQENRLRYSEALRTIRGADPVTYHHPELLTRLTSPPALLVMDLQFPITPDSETFAIIGHKYIPDLRRSWPNTRILLVTEVGEGTKDVINEC